MSDTGARLAFSTKIKALPHRFTLWLDKNGKVQRQCEMVWTKGSYVGVRFARQRNAAHPADASFAMSHTKGLVSKN
jgi:outer membrane lipoprotein-sorting protein